MKGWFDLLVSRSNAAMKLVSLSGYPRLGRRDDAVEGSCPNGGSWYSCDKAVHRFVGCCTRDPCSTAAGCAAGDLREAGMGDMPHGVYPDQCKFMEAPLPTFR